MNLLSVGASYRTAGVDTLERLTIAGTDIPAVLRKLLAQPYIGEAVILSTCNRVEVYAAVTGFHGGLGDVCNVLAEHSGIGASDLAAHLYVHYDEAAVRHSFRVTAGLDSMVVGEAQILGQLRDAYHAATESDSAVGCCTSSCSRRCGSASGHTPRPASTGPGRASSPPRSRWRPPRSTATSPGAPAWWSAPARWARCRWPP
nr:hypothetical protein GCM10020092_009220 [Actinoplanes digitatis]